MGYFKKMGVFVKIPERRETKTRLVPPLTEEEAVELAFAFLRDLLQRLGKLKKVSGTIFYSGNDPDLIREFIPPGYALLAQKGATLGERLVTAFTTLLENEGDIAVVIGSDSPDLPLPFIKRAFLKLKHKDVVLGPCADGGYYLIGLKHAHPRLFEGINWGESSVMEETLRKIDDGGLTLSSLPLWYDVDDLHSLSLLRAILLANRIEKTGRLLHTEKVMQQIAHKGEP